MQLTVCSRHAGHFQQKKRQLLFSYCNSLLTISTNAYLETYCIQQSWWSIRYPNHATNRLFTSRSSFPTKIRENVFSYCNSLFTISTNAYLETYCIQQSW